MARPSFDEYFMLQAKLAACRSTCNSRPQGAVLVRDHRVIATGYNGALPEQEHCLGNKDIACPVCGGNGKRIGLHLASECYGCQGTGQIPYCHRRASGIVDSQKDRACVSSHAEANAIAQAARLGITTNGAVLYCTTRPCMPCTKLLVQAGIIKVFYELDYDDPITNWLNDILPMEQLTVSMDVMKLAMDILRPETSRRRLARTE